MDIKGGAEALEKKLRGLVDGLFRKGQPPEPLELRRAILDDVADRVEPVGNGMKRFPFNKLLIRLAAPDDERRSVLDVAFVEEDRLENDIRERLRFATGETRASLEVGFDFVKEPDAAWAERGFSVVYEKVQPADAPADAPAQAAAQPRAAVVVLTGKAAKKRYAISRKEFHVGRGAEIRRLSDDVIVRHNDLAFFDDDEHLTLKVSRTHADIFFDAAAGEFRLRDVNSEYGTYVLRDGASLPVPKGERRGVRLRPGDEIEFGRARVKFESKGDA